MLVWRLNNCRSPTIGEKYVSPWPCSSGLNSSLALSCGLLVIAPNSAQVVSLSAFTVRSGSALPSVHQNFHPMSQGTYSASNFIRSRTICAASITSLPTPSPGIHAILYLAIRQDSIGQPHDGKIQRIHHRGHGVHKEKKFDVRSVFSVCSAVKYQLSQHRLGGETLSRIRVLIRRTNDERNHL